MPNRLPAQPLPTCQSVVEAFDQRLITEDEAVEQIELLREPIDVKSMTMARVSREAYNQEMAWLGRHGL